jgi:hypothetical protein
MTLEEAQKVARVLETADSRCSCCVRSLARRIGEAFPEFRWRYDEEASRPIPRHEDWEPDHEDGLITVESC